MNETRFKMLHIFIWEHMLPILWEKLSQSNKQDDKDLALALVWLKENTAKKNNVTKTLFRIAKKRYAEAFQ